MPENAYKPIIDEVFHPIVDQPSCACMECNDSWGPAELRLLDLGGQRLMIEAQREGKRLFGFAIRRSSAPDLIQWLASTL